MPKTISFDFNEGVAGLRKDYPKETKGQAFFNLGSSPFPSAIAMKHIEKYLKSISLKTLDRDNKDFVRTFLAASQIEKIVATADAVNDAGVFFPDLKMLLCFNKDKNRKRTLLRNVVQDNAFILHHEAGHMIADNEPTSNRKSEITADVFGILTGLRTKTMTRDDIAELSYRRALECLTFNDVTHYTTPVLKIVLKDYDAGHLTSLTPKQIKTIARKHAATFKRKEINEDDPNIERFCLKMEKKIKVGTFSLKETEAILKRSKTITPAAKKELLSAAKTVSRGLKTYGIL